MTFLLVLALTATLLTLATLIGRRLPKTHVAASRIRLDAPLDQVWDAVVDFSAYPTWRPGLARVEAGPYIDGRPSWYEYCSPRMRVQLKFYEFQPRTRLATCLVGERLPIFGAWTYDFADEGGGTVVTITESDKIYNPLLRFFSRFAFPHHAAMDVFLVALACHVGCAAKPEHLSLRKPAADA